MNERSEANNHGLFESPRYLYIYVYIDICLHVHCTSPCTPYASPITSAHCTLSFGTPAAVHSTTLRTHPLWGVTLSLGMVDGTRSAEYSLDSNTNLSHTRKATRHRKCICAQLLDRGSAPQAKLRHRGKNDWQPNDFGIFLSLLLLHYSYMYLSRYII